MVLVGAVILPHGAMSFDGQGCESTSMSCRARYSGLPDALKLELSSLFASCVKAAESIAELHPDIVVLHTPHGISLSESVGVYLNDVAKGNALWNDQWSDIEVELPMDKEFASKLQNRLQQDKFEAEGVRCFALTEAPLRWGEVVPLWYLQEQFRKCNFQPKYVILSQSLKKHDKVASYERMAIGKSLAGAIEAVADKVVVAVSGDLSHAHQHCYHDILLYLPDPRWNMPPSDKAEIFDRAVEGWARNCDFTLASAINKLPSPDEAGVKWNHAEAMRWLDFALDLQSVARSCGIGGFFVLQGLLSQYSETKTITSCVFGRSAPTYYGMMAAVFLFQ